MELAAKVLKEKDNLKMEFEKQIKSVAEKYSKYLDQSGMSPLNLPVKLKFRVLPKDLKLNGPELKPNQEQVSLYNVNLHFTSFKIKNKIYFYF